MLRSVAFQAPLSSFAIRTIVRRSSPRTFKYKDIRGPILAIFASPHTPPAQAANNPQMLEQFKAAEATVGKQIAAFENGLPNAKVVRIANADHFVFVSNEAEVLKEMNAFIAGLK